MKARGKCEAKRSASPLVYRFKELAALKGRNKVIFRPFRPYQLALIATRGDALASLRACPWLSYSAPLALCRPTIAEESLSLLQA